MSRRKVATKVPKTKRKKRARVARAAQNSVDNGSNSVNGNPRTNSEMYSQRPRFMGNCQEVIGLLTDVALANPNSEGLTLLNETIEALEKAAEKLARLKRFIDEASKDKNFERNIYDYSPRPPNWSNPTFFRDHVNNVFQNSAPQPQHSQQDLLRQNTSGTGSSSGSSPFIRNKTYETEVLNSNQSLQQNDKDNPPSSSSMANDSVAINSKELSSPLVKDKSCELKFETKPSSSQNVSYQNDDSANKDESLTPNLNTSSNPCAHPAQDNQPNKESSLSNTVNDDSNTSKNSGLPYHQNRESVESFQRVDPLRTPTLTVDELTLNITSGNRNLQSRMNDDNFQPRDSRGSFHSRGNIPPWDNKDRRFFPRDRNSYPGFPNRYNPPFKGHRDNFQNRENSANFDTSKSLSNDSLNSVTNSSSGNASDSRLQQTRDNQQQPTSRDNQSDSNMGSNPEQKVQQNSDLSNISDGSFESSTDNLPDIHFPKRYDPNTGKFNPLQTREDRKSEERRKFEIYFSINDNKVTDKKVAAALGAIGVKNGYKIHGARSKNNSFSGFITLYKHETFVKILEERYSIKVGKRHLRIQPTSRS